MKLNEMIELFEAPLKIMQRENVSVSTVKYLPMYRDYLELKNNDQKIAFIATVLCEKYDISRSKFFNLIRLFGKTV